MNEENIALLIIDMQNGFIHERGYRARCGKDVSRYQAIVPRVRKLVETMHVLGWPVIYFRHAYRKGYVDGGLLIHELFPEDKAAQAWLDGTWDTEIYEALAPTENDIVIRKNRYSAFYGTDLDLILRNLKVTAVIITGVHTNVCCDSTARDAFHRDYRVYFISDATATNDDLLHKATLKTMERYFGKVLTTEEMVKYLLKRKEVV